MCKLTIVTGASSNHFRCLKNLLYSVSLFEPGTPIIVYDLGLEPAEVAELKDAGQDVRCFPYEKYPPYFDIRIACGQYAWKPVIIANTMRETGEMVLWLDAGNLIFQKLVPVRNVLLKHGFYSPLSSNTIIRWTHPKTLKYLHATPDLLARRNRTAAIVGFNTSYPEINELVKLWERCALDINCIGPKGSNRKNHRWEQAILSVLAYQFQQKYGCALVEDKLGISIQNDSLSFEKVCEKFKPCA